jgi:hypothetical protein
MINKLFILGETNHEKYTLLLYIAYTLRRAEDKKVLIASKKTYDETENELYSICDGVDFLIVSNYQEAQQNEKMYDFCIYDIDHIDSTSRESVHLNILMESYGDVVIYMNHQIDVYNKAISNLLSTKKNYNVSLFLHKILGESRINGEYLVKKATDILKKAPTVYSYDFNIDDELRIVDQSHSKMINLNKLSKSFKNEYIYEYIFHLFEIDDKKMQKAMIKRIERRH